MLCKTLTLASVDTKMNLDQVKYSTYRITRPTPMRTGTNRCPTRCGIISHAEISLDKRLRIPRYSITQQCAVPKGSSVPCGPISRAQPCFVPPGSTVDRLGPTSALTCRITGKMWTSTREQPRPPTRWVRDRPACRDPAQHGNHSRFKKSQAGQTRRPWNASSLLLGRPSFPMFCRTTSSG